MDKSISLDTLMREVQQLYDSSFRLKLIDEKKYKEFYTVANYYLNNNLQTEFRMYLLQEYSYIKSKEPMVYRILKKYTKND